MHKINWINEKNDEEDDARQKLFVERARYSTVKYKPFSKIQVKFDGIILIEWRTRKLMNIIIFNWLAQIPGIPFGSGSDEKNPVLIQWNTIKLQAAFFEWVFHSKVHLNEWNSNKTRWGCKS
jgi:hypothetical protein